MANKNLKLDDFYNLIANESHISITTVRNVLKATYKVILEQLKFNRQIRIRYFGVFDLRQRKGKMNVVTNHNNEKNVYYSSPRLGLHFSPSQTLLSAINDYNFSLRINVGRPKLNSRKRFAKDIKEQAKKEQPENTICELLNKKIAENTERKKGK